MKKIFFSLFLLLFAFHANASAIPEGAIVKTPNNPDVYIIKYNNGKQYKRLVLNPLVFKSYGHLKWSNLLIIPDNEMNSFITSDLVRVDGSPAIYQLVPEGDNGGKYFLASLDGYDLDSVYTINDTDFNNYSNRGSRGAKIVVSENSTNNQDISDKESDNGAEAAELKAELERKQKVLAVFDELEPMLNNVNNSMSDLSDQMDAKVQDIETIKTNPYLSQSTRSGRLSIALSEYNALADQYDTLSSKKSRIATIIYELDDYAKYGTAIPAADRAYLASLGINI